jgi:hypothetical protein
MELTKKNKNLLNSDGKSKIYINYYNIIKSEIFIDLNLLIDILIKDIISQIFCPEFENGVDRCYKKYQDVPLNMYAFPTYMYKEKFFVGTSDAVEEIDYDFAKSMKEDGGKYVAFIYLNGTDEPLGFLGISFHRSTNLPDDKVIESKMRAYGNTISELLDLNVQLKKQKGGNKK